MRDYKVSVIVPVYNIRFFIGNCVRSLMEQTLAEVQFIFIDDASTDGSFDVLTSVLSDYPTRQCDVVVIKNSLNLGLPAARNIGLRMASGEYIVHCDGDDYVESRMLEKLYLKATEENADMVWCDWMLSFEGNERYMPQPSCSTGKEALVCMLRGSMKYNVWNKLAHRSLYEGVAFPEGKSMGEDMTMLKVASKAGKVAHLGEGLYHYRRTNAEALTQSYSSRRLDELQSNTKDAVGFLSKKFGKELDEEVKFFLLNVKLPFLFTGRWEDIARWSKWFSDADCYIMRNPEQSLRVKLLQLAASKGFGWINLLYYYVVQRVIYGKIYR